MIRRQICARDALMLMICKSICEISRTLKADGRSAGCRIHINAPQNPLFAAPSSNIDRATTACRACLCRGAENIESMDRSAMNARTSTGSPRPPEARRLIDAWRMDYVSHPHSALGNLTPAEYLAGPETWPAPIGTGQVGNRRWPRTTKPKRFRRQCTNI